MEKTGSNMEEEGGGAESHHDKVASRKRASQRAIAGKPWRGLKAKGLM